MQGGGEGAVYEATRTEFGLDIDLDSHMDLFVTIEIALNYWAGGVTLVKSENIFIVHMTSLVTLSV